MERFTLSALKHKAEVRFCEAVFCGRVVLFPSYPMRYHPLLRLFVLSHFPMLQLRSIAFGFLFFSFPLTSAFYSPFTFYSFLFIFACHFSSYSDFLFFLLPFK
jgi:hypothetical protein